MEKKENYYEGVQCRACCNVLDIRFTDQKPSIMLFGDDDTYCFVKQTSRDYEIGKKSPFLETFLRQSQSATLERVPKRQNYSSDDIFVSTPHCYWIQITKISFPF